MKMVRPVFKFESGTISAGSVKQSEFVVLDSIELGNESFDLGAYDPRVWPTKLWLATSDSPTKPPTLVRIYF